MYRGLRERATAVPRILRRQKVGSVEALAEGPRAVLKAVACGGTRAIADVASLVFGAADVDVGAALRELLEKGFLEGDADGGACVADPLLHDAVLDATPVAKRRAAHVVAARALRDAVRAGAASDDDVVALAHHASGADDADLCADAAALVGARGGLDLVLATAPRCDLPCAEPLSARRALALALADPGGRRALDAVRAARVAATVLRAVERLVGAG